MDRGAWRATVHRVAKRQTQLSTHAGSMSLGLFLAFKILLQSLLDPIAQRWEKDSCEALSALRCLVTDSSLQIRTICQVALRAPATRREA